MRFFYTLTNKKMRTHARTNARTHARTKPMLTRSAFKFPPCALSSPSAVQAAFRGLAGAHISMHWGSLLKLFPIFVAGSPDVVMTLAQWGRASIIAGSSKANSCHLGSNETGAASWKR